MDRGVWRATVHGVTVLDRTEHASMEAVSAPPCPLGVLLEHFPKKLPLGINNLPALPFTCSVVFIGDFHILASLLGCLRFTSCPFLIHTQKALQAKDHLWMPLETGARLLPH